MTFGAPFKQVLRCSIADGKDISFWYDNWVFESPIIQYCSHIIGLEEFRVSYFISREAQWFKDRLVQFFFPLTLLMAF